VAGTDAGSVLIYPGFSLHEELALLVRDGGLTPAQALWAATGEPARMFGRFSTEGSVAAGKRADLVLLDADPLADIGATRRIRAVVHAGRLLDRTSLDAMLAAARPPR
jgi:imidazolonepropionase-like amidohydrolase